MRPTTGCATPESIARRERRRRARTPRPDADVDSGLANAITDDQGDVRTAATRSWVILGGKVRPLVHAVGGRGWPARTTALSLALGDQAMELLHRLINDSRTGHLSVLDLVVAVDGNAARGEAEDLAAVLGVDVEVDPDETLANAEHP